MNSIIVVKTNFGDRAVPKEDVTATEIDGEHAVIRLANECLLTSLREGERVRKLVHEFAETKQQEFLSKFEELTVYLQRNRCEDDET